jgi:hypothetical protein
VEEKMKRYDEVEEKEKRKNYSERWKKFEGQIPEKN